jgi:hypothetical protein
MLTIQVRILDELDRSSARGSPVTVLSTTKAPASELEAFEVSSNSGHFLLQLFERISDAYLSIVAYVTLLSLPLLLHR